MKFSTFIIVWCCTVIWKTNSDTNCCQVITAHIFITFTKQNVKCINMWTVQPVLQTADETPPPPTHTQNTAPWLYISGGRDTVTVNCISSVDSVTIKVVISLSSGSYNTICLSTTCFRIYECYGRQIVSKYACKL